MAGAPTVYTEERELVRILAFSDGVFAIAITLLALDIRLPEMGERSGTLAAQFWGQSSHITAFFISFVVVGAFWVAHHRIFRAIGKYDARLLWLNLAVLFCIAFLPVPTAIIGEYGADEPFTVSLYASAVAATGLAQLGLWSYATWRCRLTRPDCGPRIFWAGFYQCLLTPAAFLASLAVVPFSPVAAMWMWAIPFLARPAVDRLSERMVAEDAAAPPDPEEAS
jgi:uncharacterized membrane protein